MSYINKLTGARISSSDYNRLSYSEKSNWMYSSSNVSSNSSSGDFITSGVIGAVTGSALLGGLLGGDIVGGIVGDLFDGDLMD